MALVAAGSRRRGVGSTFAQGRRQSGYSYSTPSGDSETPELGGNSRKSGGQADGAGQSSLKDMVPGGGEPGIDYPILGAIPETSFSCGDHPEGGYYADTSDSARCQVRAYVGQDAFCWVILQEKLNMF